MNSFASTKDHPSAFAIYDTGHLLSHNSKPLLPLLTLVDLFIFSDEELACGILKVSKICPSVDVVQKRLQGV